MQVPTHVSKDSNMFVIDHLLFYCFLHFIIFQNTYPAPEEIFAFVTPHMCEKNKYFDSKTLTCMECNYSKNLEPSSDHLTCTCDRNSKFVAFEHGYAKCEACQIGEILTTDGLDCITCSNNTFNNETCKCLPNEIRAERNMNGTVLRSVQCVACPENTYPSPDGTTCRKCGINSVQTHNNCPCPLISHVRIQHYCVNKNGQMDWQDVRNTYLVKYNSQQIDSYYFRTELQLAFYLCKDGNKTACQHLSNMCALSAYTSSKACKTFVDKHNSPLWLYYDEGEAPMIMNRKKISQKYCLDKDSNNSRLNITFAIFSMNGQFVSISTPNVFCDMFDNIRFGMNIEKYCKLNVRKLMAMKMEFYEPYLEFGENGDKFLYALPVSIETINKDPDDASHWQLVRKFFLIDTVAGVKAIPNSLNGKFKREDHPTIIRYVKFVHILIKVQNKEEQGKIFPPLFILDYGELLREDIERDAEVTINYKVTFMLADSNMYNAIEISIGVLSGLAIVFSVLRAWSYCRRNGTDISNILTLFWFVIFYCGMLGNIFIFVLFFATLFTFTFYKGQTVLHVLLPNKTDEENVRIFSIVAFCLKLVEIIALLYQHRNVDMFFIDWEQPRSVKVQPRYDSPRTSLKKLYANRFPADKHSPLKTPSEMMSARRSNTPSKSEESTPSRLSKFSTPHKSENSNLHEQSGEASLSMGDMGDSNDRQKLPVSIWRTYFIANEWFKIQTTRRINMLFQGIATLFILEVMEVKFLAQTDPDFTLRQLEPTMQERQSFSLKFAVGASVYVLVYCVQWLTSVTVYERYVRNRIQRFIDLCSMANISVFILAQNFYGFYIHGRSVHGFADTDLATLIDDLKKEEDDFCAHRGLLPGTTEQSFVISVSTTFRAFYNKIMTPIHSNESRFSRRDIIPTSNSVRNVSAYQKMKQFLTQFLDHCFKDVDYVVGEKQFLEKLLDIEFANATERSVFYPDENHSFDRVMFYGNEWTLATFEISLFVFTAGFSKDYTLATIVTVFASQLLVIIRKFNGRQNLANKTLIDERFLL